MSYRYKYYTEEDLYRIEQLVLAAYQWEVPTYGLSRFEFSDGLHPAFQGYYNCWRHTVGLWEENEKLHSCAISEGNYDGDAFLLFDTKEESQNKELLNKMFVHTETHLSGYDNTTQERYIDLRVPKWNTVMQDIAVSRGYCKKDGTEDIYILPFQEKPFEVKIPEGYQMLDANSAPVFFYSNVHMFSFNYSKPGAETGEQAFGNLQKMKHFNPELALCMVDPDGKPVGMAIIWYDKKMPYCELEPLGVVWWERRKGIASALIYEAANRVKQLGNCKGMTGGSQQFYYDLGFELKGQDYIYSWRKKIRHSWE